MGQSRDGAHGKMSFTYRNDPVGLVMLKDNHPVAPLQELWFGTITFERNTRGGRPTATEQETGMPVRPANMVFVEIGVPIACLLLKKGREVVAFPVSTEAPTDGVEEETRAGAPIQRPDGKGKRGPDRPVRRGPPRKDGAAKRPDKKPPRTPKKAAPDPAQLAASVPAEDVSAPTGEERFKSRYGQWDAKQLLKRQKK